MLSTRALMNTTATTTPSTWRTRSRQQLNLTRERATHATRLHAGVHTPKRVNSIRGHESSLPVQRTYFKGDETI